MLVIVIGVVMLMTVEIIMVLMMMVVEVMMVIVIVNIMVSFESYTTVNGNIGHSISEINHVYYYHYVLIAP